MRIVYNADICYLQICSHERKKIIIIRELVKGAKVELLRNGKMLEWNLCSVLCALALLMITLMVDGNDNDTIGILLC